MRKYILIASILVNTGALAQDARPVTFTVTPQELGILAQALGERPYREAAPLIAKLEAQLQEQRKAAAAPPAEPGK